VERHVVTESLEEPAAGVALDAAAVIVVDHRAERGERRIGLRPGGGGDAFGVAAAAGVSAVALAVMGDAAEGTASVGHGDRRPAIEAPVVEGDCAVGLGAWHGWLRLRSADQWP
jgi:hypothetical protein